MAWNMKDRSQPKFLVVDDEPSICEASKRILTRQGYVVKVASSGPEALELLGREPFDVVFTDLKMPEMAGIQLLAQLARRFPSVVPVVITGYATIASVVEAMRTGAYDYLSKPFTPEEMAATASKALERRRSLTDVPISGEDEDPLPVGALLAAGPAMREVLRMVEKVAPLPSTVLILGEEGTGKEQVARAIHLRSPWGEKPFRIIDCKQPSQDLLESELFGESGVARFNGGGTVFLDEVCELGPDLQGRMLQHIHERESPGRAGEQALPRLIFASGRDLGRMVEQDLFRKDLYYHLYIFPILLPPLRERLEEVPALARYFLRQSAERVGATPKELSPEALGLLCRYDWPGNVRQLRGAIEWAASICGDDPIEPSHLPVGTLAPPPTRCCPRPPHEPGAGGIQEAPEGEGGVGAGERFCPGRVGEDRRECLSGRPGSGDAAPEFPGADAEARDPLPGG